MSNNDDLLVRLDRLAAEALGQAPALGPVAERGNENTVAVYLDDARAIQPVDQLPKGETRLLGMKRTIMRFGQLFLDRQARYNYSLLEAVSLLNDQVGILRSRVGTELGRTAAAMANLDASLDDLDQRLSDVAESGGPEVQRQLGELSEAHIALRNLVRALRSDLDLAIADIRTTLPPSITDETIDSITAAARGRADAFYERFEDAMRGSVQAVRARLQPYIADLEIRRDLGGPVIDIGCGRGEWIELLQDAGFDALGIDTNAEAVSLCTARGLKVIEGDALAYLRAAPRSSVMAITGFHLVEHLDPDIQIQLVEVALRALKPGGVLILETPNPTNLVVGASSFYTDPTHLRPVNPGYLAFLFSDVGFVGVETRFLHPREGYATSDSDAKQLGDELMWALRGPQDFAVIGRKPADLVDPAS